MGKANGISSIVDNLNQRFVLLGYVDWKGNEYPKDDGEFGKDKGVVIGNLHLRC